MDNLKKKSIDGVIWNLLEKGGIHLIKLVLGIILARLLTPADYGLIAMISVFIGFAYIFVDSGFKLAYIQKKQTNEYEASTIFFFNVSISILFYGLLWLSAPVIASFYQQTQLIDLIRVMGFIIVINSFGIMQIAKLTKEVNFKKKTIIMLTSAVIAGVAGITAALLNFGVWSIVIQALTNACILTFGLWIFYKWRPLLYFNFKSLKPFLSFSSWALLSDVIRYFFENIYELVIGKYFPASQLGFYSKAKQFQGMVTIQFSKAITSVAFPVFSHLQDEKVKLKNAMRKFNQHSLFFIVPISAILFIIAKPLFLILLTDKWLPVVIYFKLLLISGVLYPIHATNVQVLAAQGKVRLNFKIQMIKNILKVLNVVIMFRFGVIYIIYGEIILSFLALIINTFYTKKILNYGLLEQIKDVSTIFIVSILLVILGTYLMHEIDNDYLKIISMILFIGSFYLISMYYFNKKLFLDNTDIIKSKFLKMK